MEEETQGTPSPCCWSQVGQAPRHGTCAAAAEALSLHPKARTGLKMPKLEAKSTLGARSAHAKRRPALPGEGRGQKGPPGLRLLPAASRRPSGRQGSRVSPGRTGHLTAPSRQSLGRGQARGKVTEPAEASESAPFANCCRESGAGLQLSNPEREARADTSTFVNLPVPPRYSKSPWTAIPARTLS